MGLGLEAFQATRKAKKSTDQIATTPVAYTTGFMPLDYMNGQRVCVYNDAGEVIEEYDSVGFLGSLIMPIADSGLGKTTLTEQMAVEIISQFDDSFVIHEDAEQASHINRVKNITGRDAMWIKNHYAIYQDTHTENVIDRFMDHAKMKLNNRKQWEYDTGLKDVYGNKIIKLKPTVVIIDSVAMLRSEDVSFTEDGKNKDELDAATNNMAGARNAKLLGELCKQILPYCRKANILVFMINHITRKIQTGFISAPQHGVMVFNIL